MYDPVLFLLIVLIALLAIPRAGQPVQPSPTVTPSAGTGAQSSGGLTFLILLIILLVVLVRP
jgi:hypothetical protein